MLIKMSIALIFGLKKYWPSKILIKDANFGGPKSGGLY